MLRNPGSKDAITTKIVDDSKGYFFKIKRVEQILLLIK